MRIEYQQHFNKKGKEKNAFSLLKELVNLNSVPFPLLPSSLLAVNDSCTSQEAELRVVGSGDGRGYFPLPGPRSTALYGDAVGQLAVCKEWECDSVRLQGEEKDADSHREKSAPRSGELLPGSQACRPLGGE